jgi:hypothetical protein
MSRGHRSRRPIWIVVSASAQPASPKPTSSVCGSKIQAPAAPVLSAFSPGRSALRSGPHPVFSIICTSCTCSVLVVLSPVSPPKPQGGFRDSRRDYADRSSRTRRASHRSGRVSCGVHHTSPHLPASPRPTPCPVGGFDWQFVLPAAGIKPGAHVLAGEQWSEEGRGGHPPRHRRCWTDPSSRQKLLPQVPPARQVLTPPLRCFGLGLIRAWGDGCHRRAVVD